MPVDKPASKNASKKTKETEDQDYIPGVTVDDGESSEEEEQEDSQSEGEGSDTDEEEISATPEPVKSMKQRITKTVNSKPIIESEKKKPSKRKRETEVEEQGQLLTKQEMKVSTDGGSGAKKKKKKEKEEKVDEKAGKRYNDSNAKYNLYHEAPENIVECKVKVSSSCYIMSKMIEANGETKGLTYDMASLVICRKMKNGNVFEFTLPLNIAPHIRTAISYLMKENTHFFNKQLASDA